jgi:lipoprotein signal peptidase
MQAELPAGRAAGPSDGGTVSSPSTATLTWWLIALVVVADQITKLMVQHYIPLFDAVTVVPGLVDLVHIHNAGVAFGLMNDMTHPFRSALTTTMALAALAGIVYYARQIRPDERLAHPRRRGG